MTAKQRRKQNQINAQASTGPTSTSGKEIACRNALKHGLTAEKLALPNENPLDIKIRSEAFHDAFDPQSHDEDVLVDELALGTLRLERFAKAETAIFTEQVSEAEILWDVTQQTRVVDLSHMMPTDPAKTLIELRSFAAGAQWLMARWLDLKKAFEAKTSITHFQSMLDLLRLCGFNPGRLKSEPIEGYELYLRTCCCTDNYKRSIAIMDLLREQRPPLWHSQDLPKEFPIEECQAWLRARIDAEIAKTQALLDVLTPIAIASRAGAADRALAPADTHENRLFLRYRNSAEMTFNRTIKTLEKLQADREKRAAEEVENEGSRNEANAPGQSTSKRIFPGSYVQLNGGNYMVAEMPLDKIVLTCKSTIPDARNATIRERVETRE